MAIPVVLPISGSPSFEVSTLTKTEKPNLKLRHDLRAGGVKTMQENQLSIIKVEIFSQVNSRWRTCCVGNIDGE